MVMILTRRDVMTKLTARSEKARLKKDNIRKKKYYAANKEARKQYQRAYRATKKLELNEYEMAA